MKTSKINLYQFAELSDKAKQKAIIDHADFLLSIGQEEETEEGEIKTVYYDAIEDDAVIENIEANEYYFFADGELADCVTYTGGHERSGETDFKFAGETYKL